MQSEEKNLIDGLFSRLRDVEGQSTPRDPQAESVIREHIARQPAAPYYMAQAIIVQENAIQQLDGRVKELEAQIEQLKQQQAQNDSRQQSSGGFLAGLFGGGRSEPKPQQPVARPQQPVARPAASSGWSEPGYGNQGGFGQQPGQQPGFQRGGAYAPQAGGGFLSGALQTAAGVAGGMVLGNVLMDLFNGDEGHAAAAETAAAAPEPAPQVAEESHAPQEDYFADSGDSGGDYFADSGDAGGDFFGGDDEDFV
ncbi:hypothetical protein AvCA_18090 [Azotobacter vinelandii CA]|uniref:Periplasmic ligand-binding sensor protein n=2 Tax=Azotobacter vinelandii TaxID=354 RepID=C1DDQ1_AZOVD|nr:DUF2076 domain-containing protein [Azotobacter vinelandii]ACO78022.1 conserved hypothetical protein [Azotobacter vinelandii DJ]AGK15169.1 hypothetical protein AvCA_18090 [Azotobacter vinelandii CA]AGK20178.1 hypothetical protein AvCA6_18090 [Azotobacter vinelandii CA6]SFX91414.1 hypothetical protein SAMN04244547_03204 [Azotobacter vinelandii]GLK61912.1 hypothetical protein GCM10017624_40760 [Azotobacter vinelandii]